MVRGKVRDEKRRIDDAEEKEDCSIVMTALTTIAGLIPMAVGSSALIGIPYNPLGRAVIGGLLASTVLTLVVVPLFYALIDDLRIGALAWWRGTAPKA